MELHDDRIWRVVWWNDLYPCWLLILLMRFLWSWWLVLRLNFFFHIPFPTGISRTAKNGSCWNFSFSQSHLKNVKKCWDVKVTCLFLRSGDVGHAVFAISTRSSILANKCWWPIFGTLSRETKQTKQSTMENLLNSYAYILNYTQVLDY